MNNITKEQIDAAFAAAIENNLLDTEKQYIEVINCLSEESKENPLARDIAAISIAQSNIMLTMQQIFYELFEIS